MHLSMDNSREPTLALDELNDDKHNTSQYGDFLSLFWLAINTVSERTNRLVVLPQSKAIRWVCQRGPSSIGNTSLRALELLVEKAQGYDSVSHGGLFMTHSNQEPAPEVGVERP